MKLATVKLAPVVHQRQLDLVALNQIQY